MPPFAKPKRQQQEPSPPPAPPPPVVEPIKQLRAFPEYVAEADKLTDPRARRTACQAEADGLQAELGGSGAIGEVDLAALELLGEAQSGAAADRAAKHSRLKVLSGRLAAFDKAIAMQEKVVDEQAFQAGRKIVADAAPAHRRLMLAHIEETVGAAKSCLTLFQFVADLDTATPAGMSGSGTLGYGHFAPLGDLRDHNSPVNLWVSELISSGTLTGNEPFLEGVALIARRPDNRVVDRPTPQHPAIAAWATPPDPAPTGAPSIFGAVGAAVRQGVQAVASLVSPGNPGRDALPPMPAVGSTSPVPSAKGPTRTIRLLRPMASVTALAGRVRPPLGGGRRGPNGGPRRGRVGRIAGRTAGVQVTGTGRESGGDVSEGPLGGGPEPAPPPPSCDEARHGRHL
jgi:hypothetical protein